MINAERYFVMYQKLVAACSILLILSGWTPSVLSQQTSPKDIIIQKDGTQREGTVLGLTKSGNRTLVNFKFTGGQIPIPMNNIRSITMEERPEYKEGFNAYRSGDYAKSAQLLQPLVDNFLGLDQPWLGEAIGMLTDSLIRQGKTFKAKEYGEKLKASFPNSPFRFKADITQARTMLEPDKVDQAIQILTETKTKLPNTAVPEPAVMSVLSDLHMALAEAHEIKGDKQKALENFLLVATVYHQPENQAKLALRKANQLRKNNPTLAVN
jgi:predicted Zn-dependent protease